MSKPGRVLARLTLEEARARPAWAMHANATDGQKRKWRMHFMTWNCDRLNEKEVADANRTNSPEARETARAWIEERAKLSATDASAIEAALRDNNIEPLLRRHPGVAKFLKVPKGGRGKYQRRKNTMSAAARWAVECLRKEIWPEHYRKKNRRNEDGLTAEEIAAEWLLSGYGDEWLPANIAEDLRADKAKKINWNAPGKHKGSRRKPRAN
jgi:hypothetical protein